MSLQEEGLPGMKKASLSVPLEGLKETPVLSLREAINYAQDQDRALKAMSFFEPLSQAQTATQGSFFPFQAFSNKEPNFPFSYSSL